MEAKGEEVGTGFLGGVEVSNLVVAVTDNVVITDDDTGDGGKKDGIG